MSIYKDMMGKIEPEASPEELAHKITEGAYKKRNAKPFAAIAAGAAAVVALTATAGAASGWNFEEFFREFFGKSAENMESYVLAPDSFEVVTNTFGDYDFEVTGLAADDYLLYAAFDVTAKNGAKISDLAKDLAFDLNCDSQDFSGTCSSADWENASEEKGTFFVRCFADVPYDGTVNLALSADSRKSCFEIRFGIEKTESVKTEVNREVMMPVKRLTTTADRFEQRWNLKSVTVSGISLMLECSCPNDRVLADDEKISVKLENGTVVGVDHGAGRGEITDGVRDGYVFFSLAYPVDVSRIAEVCIGEETITITRN